MRLSKVKLSGFKSFVDATIFELTGRLNGIVGPNGCGKSNIIDAVRWVMGESSAKQLRGESMSDVIFNGSTHRKPSGFASIELVFDNRKGMLGGKWAAYNEISIRRALDRDGKGQYFLNGARCRRRDITDIFMGTGLGPRSYAIIEQGMISRIVESKADELRVFFEEAANISKYKEKRRETELRISHTRENLDRLTDVRSELGTQLIRLEKQAEAALRYQALKQEERTLDYWRMKNQREGLSEKLNSLNELQEKEHELFQKTVGHYNEVTLQLIDEKKGLEGKETELKKENTAFYEYKQTIEMLKHELNMLNELKFRDSKSLDEWNERVLTLNNEIETYSELLKNRIEAMTLAETEIAINQENLDELNEQIEGSSQKYNQLNEQNSHLLKEINTLQQKVTLEENRFQFEKDKVARLSIQHERLNQEIKNIPENDEMKIKQQSLEEELIIFQEQMLVYEQNRSTYEETAVKLSDKIQSITNEKNKLSQKRSELTGKINALTALKSANKEQVTPSNPLYQTLTIKNNWDKAFDHVLWRWLKLSTERDQNSYFLGNVEFEFTPQHLGFYVDSSLSLGSIISHVYIVDNLEELELKRLQLKDYEWLVSKEGDLYGKDWFIAFSELSENNGLLEREGEIKGANRKIIEIEEALLVVADELHEQESEKENLTSQIIFNNQYLRSVNESIHEKEKILSLLKQENNHKYQEKERIQNELNTIIIEWQSSEQALLNLQETIDNNITTLEEKKLAYIFFKEELDDVENRYNQEKTVCESRRFSFMEAKRQFDKLLNDRHSFEHTIKRANEELKIVHARVAEKDIKTDYDEKIDEKTARLIIAEESFLEKEELLIHLTKEVTDSRERIVQYENEKENFEKTMQSHKDTLQKLALKETELKTQGEMMEQAWIELRDNLAESEIEAFISEYEKYSSVEIKSKLHSIREALNKIGAVNLVAIEESKTLAERKLFLDEQDADLNEALDTLEKAIREIDKETRERFMETFNQVNGDFSELFPRLFGGGKAYLELTEDDALTSGVNIIAHPPGKKPGTIHLLSGGEKALTAMALVFSIFNLNPAPFCMLDEIDAPLDEANVHRLGELLNEMSSKVQFIFITHNKATMTISDSLIGVTMAEPGVSRLVSVNLQEAMEFSDIT